MNELFNIEIQSGNLNSISFIVKWLGYFAVIVISVIGFGIVQSSILKNATHGLYAVSPKFWDRVDEVKKAKLSIFNRESGGGMTDSKSPNDISALIGTISTFLLSCLPNVKAMTDFDDELLDVKQYFLKAIPLMCIHIFVGAFIFLGYPSQVAFKFSEFGSGVFDVVLDNFDPNAFVEALPEDLAILKFSTDGAMDDESKYTNKIAKKAATAFIGAVSANGDISKDKRIEVAQLIEQDIIDWVNTDLANYCDSNKYKLATTATISYTGAPDLNRINGSSKNGVYTFANSWPCTKYDSGTTADVSNWYLRVDVKFTPVAQKNVKSTYDVVMSTPNVSWELMGNKGIIRVTSDSTNGYGLTGSGTMKATAILENGDSVKITVKLSGNNIALTASNKTDLKGCKTLTEVQGLYYQYNGTRQHITSITTGGSSIMFTGVDDQDVSWEWGSGPNTSEEDE